MNKLWPRHFFFHSLIIFNRLCYTYWSTNTFSTNTFTSATTRKLVWGVSPAKKRQLVDTDTDRASTINHERGIIYKILWVTTIIIFYYCVRGTRTQPLISVGCSVHYWVSSAINKRGSYFGGSWSKRFATRRNVWKLTFFDKIGHAKSVGFRFYSAIWRSESRISSRYFEITSISSIYYLTFSRKKELLFWLSRGLNRLTCVTRQIKEDSKLRD